MEKLEFGFFLLLGFWEAILVNDEGQMEHNKTGDACKIKGPTICLPLVDNGGCLPPFCSDFCLKKMSIHESHH